MKLTDKDALLMTLEHGATLLIHPVLGVRMHYDASFALRNLQRAGWDYYVTHHDSDTGSVFEHWIPLHDPRWEDRPE